MTKTNESEAMEVWRKARNAHWNCEGSSQADQAAARVIATALEARDADFQAGVGKWMDICFGAEITEDRLERGDRFIEEALELAQTVPGFTADRAHALVNYVFNRPVGDPHQEVGGVMVTLAALCNTFGLSINESARTELARVWTKVDAIRAKQAKKPTGSALPMVAQEDARDARIADYDLVRVASLTQALAERDAAIAIVHDLLANSTLAESETVEQALELLSRFILPAKSADPLEAVVNEAWGWRNPHPDVTANLRAAIERAGGTISFEGEG